MYESDKLTRVSPSDVKKKKKKKEKKRKRKDFTTGTSSGSSSSSTSENHLVSNPSLPISQSPLPQLSPNPISTPSPPHATKYKTSPTPPHQPNPPPSSTSPHRHSTDSSAPRLLPSTTCIAPLPGFSQFHTRQASNGQRGGRDKFLLWGI